MAETTAHFDERARRVTIATLVFLALTILLGMLVAAQALFFAVHAAHLLGYPYPLDYGEGPLLAQVELLRAGTPIWRLYSDPGAPPYAVVNYPPVYLLTATFVSWLVGDPLLAGRLVSLAATLGTAATLWAIAAPLSFARTPRSRALLPWLVVLVFLGLPIVREWAVLMRVDMLGLCLGLFGLLVVQRAAGRRALWAALPLVLGLFVKPSLIAASAAAVVWLLFRDWRRAIALGGVMAAGAGLLFGVLQVASGGWFAVHVFAANANAWDYELARQFWHDQMVILWPLVAAGAVGCLVSYWLPTCQNSPGAAQPADRSSILLPLYYTLFGAIVAFGVGKVGAYVNYFLEFYAGLIWLGAAGARRLASEVRTEGRYGGSMWAACLLMLLAAAALVRYYPTWSANHLKLAGIIEKINPPRLSLGRYGVWRDLQRERDILNTLGRVNAALVDEVRVAGAPIFTDLPGVAAQAGQLARLQAFEHRQLLDAGLWNQRVLLRDLANGDVPLIVLDYLGNWLTPEMIALITHRYAQDGSRGTYDLYRPVDPGPRSAVDLEFPDGLRLVSYHLAPSPAGTTYQAGEPVLLTLEWQRQAAAEGRSNYEVVVQLASDRGAVLWETAQPLLYGALPVADWPLDASVQHMQPVTLPAELPARTYDLMLTLRVDGENLVPGRSIIRLVVAEQGGQQLGAQGYFVPGPLLAARERFGGDEGVGEPLMPAVPFRGYTLQCFVLACLQLDGAGVRRAPLGELVHLADVGLRAAGAPDEAAGVPETHEPLRGPFLTYWREHGGEELLGPPITGELIRGDAIVQYTRYVRLERPIAGGDVRLGRLGEEFLRLPGGTPYRWP